MRNLSLSDDKAIFSLILISGLLQNYRVSAQSDSVSKSRRGVVKGEIGAKLDELLTRLAMYGFSGAVLAAKDGKIILNRGYGLADRERNLPNTAETVFAIGSLTKQFTVAAILQLEAQGKLKTQDLASKYLGEFPQDKTAITLCHLLTHTSGLISDGANAQLPLENRDEYIEAVKKSRLRPAPGEKFYYSNVGYNLLAGQEFSGTANPSEYAASFKQWWEDFVRNNGAVKSQQVMGTARSRTGHAVTFVRIEYEKTTKVLRLLWLKDKLSGHGSGVPRPATAQYLPESQTKFTFFDILTSQLTSIGFSLKENGIASHLIVPSKAGNVIAKRLE